MHEGEAITTWIGNGSSSDCYRPKLDDYNLQRCQQIDGAKILWCKEVAANKSVM